MTTIKLYNYWRSSASYRVRIALHLKKIPFEYVPVNLLKGAHKDEEFLSKNPMGYVPSLEINGEFFAESIALLELLDALFPAPEYPSLYPSDPKKRAHVQAIVHMIASGMQPLHNLNVLDKLSQDQSVRKEWAQHFITRGLTALERALTQHKGEAHATGPYAFGETFSAADACILPQIYGARRYEVDLSPFPRLCAINEAGMKLEAVQKSIPEHQIDAVL